ncbi:MAG: ABC transporter ATP-binding protein [Treponema sp.]|jgi:branched-chain amino acid transport system ATP-binding protein|nr:ABC transporter ATP-binding protein [Treponema sp.]
MVLRVNDLVMQFGGLAAVNHVSFEVPGKTICALIGPNGAGKTTIFNMISGALVPTSGKVIFKEKEIQGLLPYKINNLGIARTYQNINLFRSMTVLENIMVGMHSQLHSNFWSSLFHLPGERREEREMMEKCLDLIEYVGLKDRGHDVSRNLSYGNQRLLEIGRALASSPALLLLDEPAAGMNTTEKRLLAALIRKIRQDYQMTILLVEHEMRLVMELAENIFVLNFGEKIAEGAPAEIQSNEAVITAYLGGGKK